LILTASLALESRLVSLVGATRMSVPGTKPDMLRSPGDIRFGGKGDTADL
jgi:hypothetical protein